MLLDCLPLNRCIVTPLLHTAPLKFRINLQIIIRYFLLFPHVISVLFCPASSAKPKPIKYQNAMKCLHKRLNNHHKVTE